MSELKINAALVQGLTAAALGIPTGNEGKNFDPPAVTLPWAKWHNLHPLTWPALALVAWMKQSGCFRSI